MSKKAISVIIPVYNQAHYLAQAINSVLLQSLPPLEVIVINDGSSDHIYDVMQPFFSQVRYLDLMQNKGASFARNIGVEQAKGDFIAFLDGDDFWHENKLCRQYQLLEQNPEVDFAFSHMQAFHSQELSEPLKLKLSCPEQPMPGYMPSAFLGRKSSFLKVGHFNTTLETGEFIDWYLRAQKMDLRMTMDDAITVFRRIHQGHYKKSYKDYFSIIKHKLRDEQAVS